MVLPIVVPALVAALAVAAGSAAGALVAARPAWAHAELLRTEPAADSVVTQPVAAVTLVFNQPVKERYSTVVVTGPDGGRYASGPARAVDSTLTQPVTALPAGPVRVTWRVVSVDGDPVQGQFTFTNAAPDASGTHPGTPSVTASGPPPGAAPATGTGDRGTRPQWWLGGLAALVVLAAGAGAVWRLRRRRRPDAG